MGDGQINATGGTAYAPAEYGGYAIYAENFYVGADCTLVGGSGSNVSEAVYTSNPCRFFHVNATVKASGAGTSAFAGAESLNREYCDRVRSEDYSEWVFTAIPYTLTFDGAGGTMNGQAALEVEAPFSSNFYPEEVELSSYVFTRSGYKQTGWQLPDGTVIAVDAVYTPEFNPYSSTDTNITLIAVWEEEGSSDAVETIAMHRLYNPNSGEHFYTGSLEEKGNLEAAGWIYEGVAWNAPVSEGEPVYRMFNPVNPDHHYTMSWEEVQMLVAAGWNYEGVAWNSASPENVPLHRLFNPNALTGIHHYTGSIEERDYLISLGWIYEGIGWYGIE